jgi:uncharacterized membrane protein YjjP (DUF1212 family)
MAVPYRTGRFAYSVDPMAPNRPRPRSSLRRGLRIGLRGTRDPVSSAGQRQRRDSVDLSERYTRQVLDLTVRLAEVMLSSGSGTADVVATAQDVAHAYRLSDSVVDITFNTIIVSTQPTPDAHPVTIVRAVRSRGTDYSRLADLDALVRRITVGGVTPDEALRTMDELTERPHPYPRWLATVGWAGFAFGVAMLLGGSWLTCVLAAITTAAIDRLGRLLNHARLPFFFLQAAGAVVATAIAVLAFRFAGLALPTLVATGIVVLLSGLTLVGAVQDALTNHMVTATARLGDAIFMTAGIVVGIVIVLELSTLVGLPISLQVDATTPFRAPGQISTIIIAVLGSVLAGVSLMIAGYAPARTLLAGGVASGLAELLVIIFASIGFGQVLSSGLAAVAVGLAATTLSVRRLAPAVVTVMAGITPLLPGLAVFRAVFALAVGRRFDEGLGQLLTAAAVALALGSGVVMGEFLSSPLRVGAGRLGRLLRVDDVPGLRRAVGAGVILRSAEPVTGTASRRTGSLPLVPVGEGPVESEDGEDDHPDTPGGEPNDDR